MPRRSIKENKNIYMRSREAAGLTRDAASEQLGFISADRIYRIENGALPDPEEVLQMAKIYQDMSLCNYYCANECRIGQKYVPEIEIKDLSQITVEMLATLNHLNKDKDRLLEIAVDGMISADEIPDFLSIQDSLEKMSITIDALKLWVDQKIAEGQLDRESFSV